VELDPLDCHPLPTHVVSLTFCYETIGLEIGRSKALKVHHPELSRVAVLDARKPLTIAL
jgi:hypothetical protein